MREILFRGKRESNGEWVYGAFVNEKFDIPFNPPVKEEYIIQEGIGLWVFIKSETVGQYTGLTDKNGNKIFEGDILSSDQYPYTSDDKQNYFAEVVWFDDCPAFGLYTFKAPKSLVRGISEGCEFIEDDLSDFEIIGNIHDNPELIGGDAQ